MPNTRRCETCHAYLRRDGGCTACENQSRLCDRITQLQIDENSAALERNAATAERDQALADLRTAREKAVADYARLTAEADAANSERDAAHREISLLRDDVSDARALLADAQKRAADCDQLRDALRKSVAAREQHSADALRMARYMGYAIAFGVVGALAAVAGWVR